MTMGKVMSIEEQRKLGLVTQKGGIYAIVVDEDVVYIGSATDLIKRQSVHKSSLKGGYHHNKSLQKLYNELNDKDDMVFTVLMTVSECNEKDLFKLENNLMKIYKETLLNKNRVVKKVKLIRSPEDQARVSEVFRKANRGAKNPRSKISESDAKDIIEMKKKGVKTKEIAEKYKLSEGYIYRIGGERWSHLTDI